jgi:hypothetical protein
MPQYRRRPCCLGAAALAALTFVLAASPVSAEKWKTPNPAELALAAPAIDKDADAEVLEWDVRVAEAFENGEPVVVYDHYIRMKIFTDRGRDTYGRVDITHGSDVRISAVEARTIAASGLIQEVKGSDIFRRTLVKGEDGKIGSVSFALPSVQKGSIVEYGWTERHADSLATNLRLPLQRDVPVHVVRYHLKPLGLEDEGYGMRIGSFQVEPPPLKREANGFYTLSMEKMPAFKVEPHMPPEEQVRPWVLVHYMRTSAPEDPLAFWKDFGKRISDDYRPLIKVTDEVRRAATEACAGATSPEDKVAALFRYLRDKIQRTDVDTAPPDLARGDVRDHSAKEILKRGKGDAYDVLVAFLALGQAAGLDARLALASDRSDIPFIPGTRAAAVMPGRLAAVAIRGSWRFVDPANRYSRAGEPRWWHEDQAVLVTGGREPEFLKMSGHSPAAATRKRMGRFNLLADGTLEGELRFEYGGHWGVGLKESEDADTPAEREQAFRKLIIGRLSGAEVSAVTIENVTSFDVPYRVSATIRVPGYAQRVGSRLIFQPNVFERGIEAPFSSAERRHPIFLSYARSEEDEITFELPKDLEVEARPKSNRVGLSPVMTHEITLEESPGKLVHRRRLRIGENGLIDFEAAQYIAVKDFFDRAREVDTQPVTLRRAASGR